MPITPNILNVLFLFAHFSLLLKYPKYFILFLTLSIFVEYGVYGFLFGWTLWRMKKQDKRQGILGSFLAQLLSLSIIRAFSLLALPLLNNEKGLKLPRIPKYFFYLYYPLHQIILIWLVK